MVRRGSTVRVQNALAPCVRFGTASGTGQYDPYPGAALSRPELAPGSSDRGSFDARRCFAVAERKPAQKSEGFTDEERAAMKERAHELKAARASKGKADGESDVLAKIAEMPDADRAIAERLHALVKAAAPALSPRTWYGMPAYARNGKVVCFFQSAQKFKTRYATLGFSDQASLDEGAMWPTAFALKELTATEEKRIVALLDKAVS
jgi:uncharacterized protein YdhG (YjbR/CyaY superfamily)